MTTKTRLGMACMAGLLLGAGSSAHASEAIDLRPNWTPGETKYIQFVWDNEDTEKGSDFPQDGQQSHRVLTFGSLHEVTSVDASGNATIKLTIDRLALAVERGDLRLFYDTDTPEKEKGMPDYGRQLQSLVGESFMIVVQPDGLINTIEGLIQIERKAMPADNDLYAGDFDYVRANLTPYSQKEVWRQYYGAYSFTSVSTGDTWTRRIEDDPPLDVNYTLEGIESGPHGPLQVVTHQAHFARETGWRDRGDRLVQSGPYDASGRTLIDADGRGIVSGEETVHQEIRAKRLDQSGQQAWWTFATNSAKHTLTVLTKTERDAMRTAHHAQHGS